MILWFAAAAAVGGSLAARASRRRGEASGEQVPPAAARVALLSTDRLDWDAKLSFAALEAAAGSGGTLVRFSGTMPGQVAPRALQANASVLVTKELPVTAKQIAALPSTVELIVEAGTGYNNIDIQAARERGITVCACPAYSTEAVATQVLTFLLAFSSSLHRLQALARDGNHAEWASVGDMPHFELRGKTLGLVGGRGNIGSEVARLARTFGMRVLVSSRTKARMVGAEVVTDVEELLERSDFVSIHCPLNADTHGFIDGAKLAMMKRSAFLINTARGAIVDEAALCSAIKNGIIAGAGLDVFSNEPLPKTSPLWELLCSQDPRVMLTPHIGWQRLETRQRLMSLVADNVRAFLREKPINVVN